MKIGGNFGLEVGVKFGVIFFMKVGPEKPE